MVDRRTDVRSQLDDAPASERQAVVDRHFSAKAEYWERLYTEHTVFGVIHQERHARALQWIDQIGLPRAAHVLEIGCGAGLMAADLFRRGFVVDCMDPCPAMVALARSRAESFDACDRMTVHEGDAHSLQFADASCDLVVALGVLPYLHSPAVALGEVARVLATGGYLLLSSDNPYRLTHLLDPRLTPLLGPLKRLAKRILRRHGYEGERLPARAFPYLRLTDLLRGAGFRVVAGTSFGFGPFTLFTKRLLPESAAIMVHRHLQALADRGVPVLASTGAQHLVLAVRQANRVSDGTGRVPASGRTSTNSRPRGGRDGYPAGV